MTVKILIGKVLISTLRENLEKFISKSRLTKINAVLLLFFRIDMFPVKV